MTAQTLERTATASEPGFLRLGMLEVRKMVDTRASAWIFGSLFVIAATIVVGSAVANGSRPEPIGFSELANSLGLFASLAMPLIGILGMTSDWAHRTTYVFFPLTRNRTALFWAKVAAAATVAVLLQLFCFMVAAVVAVVTQGPVDPMNSTEGGFFGALATIGQSITICLLSTLFGVGIAALIRRPMLSILAVVLITLVGNGLLLGLLPEAAGYLGTITALGAFAGGMDAPSALEVISSLFIWYVAPLLGGWWLALKTDV